LEELLNEGQPLGENKHPGHPADNPLSSVKVLLEVAVPPELLSAFGTLLTAIIIGATAVAALIQLRHIRASNELSAFNEQNELWYSQPVQEGYRFIQRDLKRKMEDPQFRRDLDTAGVVDHLTHPDLNVLDFVDNIGVMITLGMMREDIILHPGSQMIDNLWTTMGPTVAIMRRKRERQLYVSFEYLAHRARLWQQRYPNGLQPAGWSRLPNPDVWSSADTRNP